MKTIYSLMILFTLIISCSVKKEKTFNTITNINNVLRIEYYDSVKFSRIDSNRKPNKIITDTNTIKEIVNDINHANNPSLWKGAFWNKIHLIASDTTIILSTNGEVIGNNINSGNIVVIIQFQIVINNV